MIVRPVIMIERLIEWLRNTVLPAWAEACLDDNGVFYEALDFDGKPITGMQRRVRVQSRQIYTFTRAAQFGWLPAGEAMAERAFGCFIQYCCPDNGMRGCVHLIDDHAAIVDETRDFYDQAFLLLACAARIDAGDERALTLAKRAIAFLDAELAAPNGGYYENDGHSTPRRQNPHMHMFEALLALYESTMDRDFIDRARSIYDLLARRFWDPDAAALREFFNADWSVHEGQGARIEPGHMAEWSHLIRRYTRLSGVDYADLADTLVAAARRTRINDGGVFLPTQATIGKPAAGPRRLWPQTELLRAYLAEGAAGEKEAAATIEALFKTYFSFCSAGMWCDEFDAYGAPAAKNVPASMLYHIHEAAADAARRLKQIA